jgi:hypothetical protein
MKGNNMTNQTQPGQQNQAPGQKPIQQHGGGQKPGQQSQTPGRDAKTPKEPYEQTSDTVTKRTACFGRPFLCRESVTTVDSVTDWSPWFKTYQ